MKTLFRALALVLLATAALAQAPAPILVDPAPDGVRIEQPGLLANYYRAPGGKRAPAVLAIGGSEGGLGPGVTRQARALAAHGYNVLNVSYFGGPGEPKVLAKVPLETFTRALDWLASRPEVDQRRIAVVGGSKGAEAALLVASRDRRVRAVAVGMPSSVVWPGIDYTPDPPSSWTAGGEPLPPLPYVMEGPFSIYSLYDKGLANLDKHPDAVIPVERIAGPVMLVCGKADTLWPSCRMADQIEARLKAKHFHHHVERLIYADAGHAVFGVPVAPNDPALKSLGSIGGTPEGNNAARLDGWPKVLAFLDAALKP